MAMFDGMIREHLGKVERWARDDRNPQAYAEVFMDELPQMVASYLKPQEALDYLLRADWWEQVTRFYPGLIPYKEWCSEFRDELIAFVTDQIEELEVAEVPEQITDIDEPHSND